jgi:hypothetical protein
MVCRKCGVGSYSNGACSEDDCDGVSAFIVAADGTMTASTLSGNEMSRRVFVDCLAQEDEWGELFRGDFARSLIAVAQQHADGGAFFWECASFQPGDLESPFICEILPGRLSHEADGSSFAEHGIFDSGSPAAFTNLSGDSMLIAPRLLSRDADQSKYAHLSAFLSGATAAEVAALWQSVGNTAKRLMDDGQTFWMSTHGGGVPWLHVRLDRRPKYFSGRFR